jgi:hypothetical protein
MNENDAKPKTKRPTEAYVSEKLFENGLGYVVVARFKAGGRLVEAGIFLVDTFCLGAKNCDFTEMSEPDYQERVVRRLSENDPMKKVEPAYARKLVEDAVAYAQHLGFAPHRDYKKACRVLGGIDARTCTDSFTFGKDGKPLYIRGPGETQEQADRIIAHLRRVCGDDNYHFMMPLGDTESLNKAFGGTPDDE